MEEELDQLNSPKDQLIVYLVENGMRIAIALLIIALGFWLGKSISKIILKICEKREIDLTLARFFAGFTKLLIIAFSLIIALSKAGSLSRTQESRHHDPLPSARHSYDLLRDLGIERSLRGKGIRPRKTAVSYSAI